MLNETILEMRYCQINFGKNRQGGGGRYNRFPYLGLLAQNKKKVIN